MGTNYYYYSQMPCEKCNRPYDDEKLHIGKSSAGWCFSLHVYPEDGINDLDDWRELWEKKETYIEDEYGEKISMVEMVDKITNRRWKSEDETWETPPIGFADWEQFHNLNNSLQGPRGLLRHRIDGRYCIKHGAGTYDCLIGDFS